MLKLIVAGARGALALVPVLLRDLIALAGAGSVAYGTWLIFEPAGFIVGGLLLIMAAVLAQRAGN